MVQTTQVQAQVRELSTRLGLAPPFTAAQLAVAWAEAQGCTITLQPEPMEGEVYGLCTLVEGVFVVFYRADAGLLHQQHIQFHELAHIVLGHITPDHPTITLRSGVASTPQEREAETFAAAMTSYALFVAPETLTSQRLAEARQVEPSPFSWFLQLGNS